jgi:hypothetical protein
MFGSAKTPYEEISTNARELVKYVRNRNVIYEIGNESTMSVSYAGYTDAATYAKIAGGLIYDMMTVKPDIKCIVNGNTPDEFAIVSKIPGTVGIAIHNYPGFSIKDWMAADSKSLVQKVIDCKAKASGKDVYITETSSTNFTPQHNSVGLSLMNIDIILHSLAHAPKCVMNWATRWNYKVPINPNIYSAMNDDDTPTGLGHMIRLVSFAVSKVCDIVKGKCMHTNVVMNQVKNRFIFANYKKNLSTIVIINKLNKNVRTRAKAGTVYTLYGPPDSNKPLFETYASTGKITLKPMSLTVIV